MATPNQAIGQRAQHEHPQAAAHLKRHLGSQGNHSVSLLRSFLHCCPEALVTVELDVGFIVAAVVLNRRSTASRSTCVAVLNLLESCSTVVLGFWEP
ncbi:hypothetical protein V6N13_042998 [Hibiscus sabdariffa]